MRIKKTIAAVLPLIMSTGIAADVLSSSVSNGYAEGKITPIINETINVTDSAAEQDQDKKFGDINRDSVIDGRDATSLLTYYAKTSIGYTGSLEEFIGETSKIIGDINGDSIIDGRDATSLLTYYAKASIGYSESLDMFIGEETGVNPLTGEKVSKSSESVTTTVTAVVTATTTASASTTSASTTTSAPASVINTTTVSSTPPTTTTANNEDSEVKTDGMYYMWLDISKDENYVFNDKYLKITFKIKEGIPDADYEIKFKPDFSSIEGNSVIPDKILQGTIRVGSETIDAMDVSGEDGFVAYGDNVACKQGDTIDYYLNLKNNPGLAAVLIWFYYDGNAMEVTSIKTCGDFGEVSHKGDESTGTKPAKK